MRELVSFFSEGYATKFREDDAGRVFGIADFDIDADGANGQHGALPAYMVGDKGSELLANGGMRMMGSRVVCRFDWARDIVICGADGEPRVFDGGVIASKTAYRFQGKGSSDPAAYVDSATVPYIVVQSDILKKTKGAVLGCKARATNLATKIHVDCIVADVGPRAKIGEGSIALAKLLGIPSSPRSGGIDYPGILFELWPGVFGEIDGQQIPLLTSAGAYVTPAA